MNRRFLVIALSLLALGLVVFFVAGNTTEAPTNTQNEGNNEPSGEVEPTGETVTVTYTDSGYSPESVTIAPGTTVTFVNESSMSMWPATNIHPTHTVYPGSDVSDCGSGKVMFDACEQISPGESWSFTFGEVGNWRYHDHMRATRGGTIIVE